MFFLVILEDIGLANEQSIPARMYCTCGGNMLAR